jgi:hypothetical protein
MNKHRKRKYTREELTYRKYRVVYFLCIVLWAAFIVGVLFLDVTASKSVDVGETVTHDKPVVVQVIPEPTTESETEAVEATFDPVRDDVPMDAELQCLLYQACGETGIRYELALAVIWQETDFRNVVGDGGESYGYMQVQPKWHSERMERLGVSDLSDPYGNFLVGLDYLSELLERYDLSDALTAYNSGKPGNSQYARSVLNYMNILTMEDF